MVVIFHSYVSHYQRVNGRWCWDSGNPNQQLAAAGSNFCQIHSNPSLETPWLFVNAWEILPIQNWLVVEPYPSEKYESVGAIISIIPKIWKVIKFHGSKPTRESSGNIIAGNIPSHVRCRVTASPLHRWSPRSSVPPSGTRSRRSPGVLHIWGWESLSRKLGIWQWV